MITSTTTTTPPSSCLYILYIWKIINTESLVTSISFLKPLRLTIKQTTNTRTHTHILYILMLKKLSQMASCECRHCIIITKEFF